MFQMKQAESRQLVTIIVYLSLLLDNMLLTVIVPILPDYLTQSSIPHSVAHKNFTLHYVSNVLGSTLTSAKNITYSDKHITLINCSNCVVSNIIDGEGGGGGSGSGDRDVIDSSDTVETIRDENSSIGVLLAIKAVIQIIVNPVIGAMTTRFGYRLPLIFGTINLFITAVLFAVAESYFSLFFARALQGVGSACVGVCGMSLIAHLYPEDEKRSKVMGVVLGSVALGVLLGYPIGGILYDFVGKSMPFYAIAVLLFIDLALQFHFIEFHVQTESGIGGETCSWWPLLSDQIVILIACAIWISTSAMAVLEPCLPIWLIQNLHAKKWQLGTVFIPDSVGYLIGTNSFGGFAYKAGQIKVAMVALCLVGVSCLLISNATSISGLLIPHFGLGLGIGVIDAALVPFLASAVDAKYTDNDSIASNAISNYGAVYAIQQMAVSLAYSVVPMIAGELVNVIGFPWLMRLIGVANIIYAPFLLYETLKSPQIKKYDQALLHFSSTGPQQSFSRFYDAVD